MAGLAVTVVLVPGVARANVSDPAPVVPPASVPGPLGDALTQLPAVNQPGTSDQTPAGDAQQQDTQQQDTSQPADTAAATPTLPPQLQQLLDQLKSLQPPSSECSAAIQADLTQLLTDVPSLIQAIVTDLLGQLSSGTPPTPTELLGQLTGLLGQLQGQSTAPGQQSAAAADASSTPDPTIILADLQKLVTDLTTKCLPAPPTITPPTSSSPPATQSQPPVQSASQPPAQPVDYPGYAPTGAMAPASNQGPAETVPLSALGGVLLVSAAAAVGVRARARRSGR